MKVFSLNIWATIPSVPMRFALVGGLAFVTYSCQEVTPRAPEIRIGQENGATDQSQSQKDSQRSEDPDGSRRSPGEDSGNTGTIGGSPASNSPQPTNPPIPNIPEPTGDQLGYLFTRAQVQAIESLVDPYIQPPIPQHDIRISNQFQSIRSVMEQLINLGLALPTLSPGRSLKVLIEDTQTANAWADGYQRIGFEATMLRISSPASIFSTLCHEVAHSTKNHVASNVQTLNDPRYKQAIDVINTYMNLSYSRNAGRYTHRASDYQQARNSWDTLSKAVIFDPQKRRESEGDIIGMFICARMGMNPQDYNQAHHGQDLAIEQWIQQNRRSDVPAPRPENLVDGQSMLVPESQVANFAYFLFPADTHPKTEERNIQLKRIQDLGQKFFASDQTIYQQWLNNPAVRQHNAGLALYRQQLPSPFIEIVTESGEILQIPKPMHKCNLHGH